MKTGTLIYYIGQSGSWYPGTVIKVGEKKVKISTDETEKWVYPKNLELQNNKIAEDKIGTPIHFSKLPKTGDPKYLPQVIKDADSKLIDIDGIIKQNVGIGWVQIQKATISDYHKIPYLITN